MIILRKILGVFLLLLSIYIGLAYIGSLRYTINELPVEEGPERFGSIFGMVIFGLFIVALVYFVFKKGLKLLKRKPQNEIDEIGK